MVFVRDIPKDRARGRPPCDDRGLISEALELIRRGAVQSEYAASKRLAEVYFREHQVPAVTRRLQRKIAAARILSRAAHVG
jgi:hypothetical protein